MTVAIQAISSHPLVTRAVEEILGDVDEFQVLPAVSNEEEAISYADFPRLFLLDACSLPADLRSLIERFRSRLPGSKFLALVPPSDSDYVDAARLFYWGIEGFVLLSETWQIELPHAIHNILNGHYWVPSEVLMALVSYIHAPEQTQPLPGHSLTVRERQVLRLLMRHLTNKEISKALDISERTVKFHVSRILAKLGAENRRDLSLGTLSRFQFNGAGATADLSELPNGGTSSSNSRTRLRR
jgi:DNA-binding NarL/FixJ family response regulator